MANKLVLIVDDEEGIRETLSDIFRDEGYNVITASSGEEAIKILKENIPDIVFLDVWLSGINGLETLIEIKSIHPTMPIIMISGHATTELAVKAVKLGAYNFLDKPLSLEKVLLETKLALEKRKLEIENRALKENIIKNGNLLAVL